MSLDEFWRRLSAVHELSFNARSNSAAQTGWNGVGRGLVQVEMPDATTLLFREHGTWSPGAGREFPFHNVYRWSLLPEAMRLEHLRFGLSV